MLETLVSSRIRRTLFEYVLTHQDDRFYLRGLAKDLHLPISPLRRELKRLEQAGMLSAAQEANIVFYHVNTASPSFIQLQHAGQQIGVPLPEFRVTTTPNSELPTPNSIWRSPLSSPVLVAAAGVGVALMLVVVGLLYLSITNQQLASQTAKAVATRKADVTMVTPSSSSGAMHGSRWQIVPGGFGGFSSGANDESY